jgi:chemotaxis protein methyltransferase CheR
MPSDHDDACLRDAVEPPTQPLFDTRLTPISRLAGLPTLGDHASLLRAVLPGPTPESLTVSETSFFRDACLFEVLHTTILPTLIRLRQPTRRLRIWSAAASTGQEAFSLAILLADLFPQLADWDIRIIGTDISRHAIDYAQRGHFRANEVHRGLVSRILDRYFTHHANEWTVHPRIADLCDFRCANLCAPLPPLPRFDLILLRNVLLYLTPADRTNVLANMHCHLAPDGYLILGASEQAEDSTPLFHAQTIEGTYLYRPAI